MRHRLRAPRRRPPTARRQPLRAAIAAVALAAAALLLSPAQADDRDLLRFDSAKPYLFILLDTSSSMALKMGKDEWAPGGADGPDSRLFQAKQALFNVLRDVEDVHFGFVAFNQDNVRAQAKHWLYYSGNVLPPAADWPIQFPRPDLWDMDADGSRLTRLVSVPRLDANGNPILSDPNPRPIDTRAAEIGGAGADGKWIDADLLTFGPPLLTPAPDGSGRVIAGTCGSPLDLAVGEQRSQVQSLAVQPSSLNPTFAWVKNGGNTTYLLSIRRPGKRPDDSDNATVGQDKLHVLFELKRVASGNNCGTLDTTVFDAGFGGNSATRTLRLDLSLDAYMNQFFHVNHHTWAGTAGGTKPESTMPGWLGKDVISESRFESAPHTGFGWEGNYDSGIVTENAAFNQVLVDSGLHEADYCASPSGPCLPRPSIKPQLETVLNPDGLGRAFDVGDMLPFDWNISRRNQLLSRLDPQFDPQLTELGDFRVARHFGNVAVGGALPLATGHRPLVAADLSPLGRTLADIRCWYLGSTGTGGSKCKETTFDDARFDKAWSQVACERDTSFGCRRNFLIILGDGEDNVPGQDANGAVGNLQNSASMLTWALNLGDPKGCSSGGGLHSIVRAGGGECINVQTQERLRQVLESLIGQFRTTARSFASAAVPSVQATVEQKIFLTSFLPFNDSPLWKGSVHAFVKPLPVSSSGVPLTEKKCDGSGSVAVTDSTQGCHLWDAGEQLFAQHPDSGTDRLDLADRALRRVFYAQNATAEGEWPRGMRLLDPTELGQDPAATRQVRHDLWRAMGVPFKDDDSDAATAQANANAVVDFTLRRKSGSEVNTDFDPPTTTVHEFVMGDVFHSTPVVIGTPQNTVYFAGNLYDNQAPCDPDDGTASANPGYRCFFEKQRLRRKMLLVGSNDGMLHAFDAGTFRRSGTDHWTGADLVDEVLSPLGSFDNGTGKELFGFVPRTVLPTLRTLSFPNSKHRFNVDGTVTVADVFVDPVRELSTSFPLADDREWRTVVVGGLREGGRGYYALDITQPDPVAQDDDLGFVPQTGTPRANDPASGNYVPVCTAGLTSDGTTGVIQATPSGCGPVPFPAVRWEFTDSFFDPITKKLWFADEETSSAVDGQGVQREHNGRPDLAATWSTPNVGRIRICKPGGTACDPTPEDPTAGEDADLIDVFVAIFGGGMDPDYLKRHRWDDGPPLDKPVDDPTARRIDAGNWLYMVDIETGEAIYKRELEGSAPSEPAAVDTDGDGYLDRIYIGTLAGALYRVDLAPLTVSGDQRLPAPFVEPVMFTHRDSAGALTHQLFNRLRVPPDVWAPVKLFDTNFEGAAPLADNMPPRPIYHRPSVVFQAQSGLYVLAFGTGDREDLWNIPVTSPEERFYVFVDRFRSTADISSPMREAELTPIVPDVTPLIGQNLLASNDVQGWVMHLAPKERVITDAFALSGVTVFSSFVPRTEDGEGNETVVGCVDGQIDDGNSSKTCAKQGVSHVFVVNTTNGDGLLFDGDSDVRTRYKVAPTFVTNPFAEPGQSKRPGEANESGEFTADDLSPNMLKVMEALQGLFPAHCKFANYRIDIKTVAADTSLQFIAPVPVCLIERNWKEF